MARSYRRPRTTFGLGDGGERRPHLVHWAMTRPQPPGSGLTPLSPTCRAAALPGLHDAHVHPAGVMGKDCNLDNEPVDLAQLVRFCRAAWERLAIPDGDWLLVKQW